MDYAAAAEALMRRRILEEMYDRMTDEERRLFVRMAMEQRPAAEIMEALGRQSSQLQDISRHQQTFAGDFLSNILGNATWDGALWLVRALSGLARR